MNFAIAAAGMVSCMAAWKLYWHFIQPVPLFELDDPKQVCETLKWLSDKQLVNVRSNGRLTRYQWRKLKSQVMREIDASLGTRNGRGAATGLI